MNILLVIPSRAFGNNPSYTKFPDEMLCIAAVLEQGGHEVQLWDCNLDNRTTEEFVGFAPSLIGFSVATGPNITHSLKLSTEFKILIPSAKFVWGFRHPSSFPEQTLAESLVDFVVVGSGEYTLLELANQLEKGIGSFYDIDGLGFKDAGKIIINNRRQCTRNLDELPDPAWHLINVHRYHDITLNTSRGCPHSCTFCADKIFYQGAMSDLSAQRIVAQMARLHKEYKVSHLFFSGERFTLNRERLREFCALVITHKIKVTWTCPVTGGLTNEDVSLMARSGCVSVLLEIESGSQKIINLLQKGSLAEMESAYWLMVNNHIVPTLFIMYGIPCETVEDFQLSLKMLNRLDNPPYIYMKFVPFPDTWLYDYCADKGLFRVPNTLPEWAEFPVKCANEYNLSGVPENLMEQAMSLYWKTYNSNRVGFMFRHNRKYFLKLIHNPFQFIKAVKDLFRYYLIVMLDSANGSESWLLKYWRKFNRRNAD